MSSITVRGNVQNTLGQQPSIKALGDIEKVSQMTQEPIYNAALVVL